MSTDLHAATTPVPGVLDLTFDIGGMTCASCVRRVEKSLGKVEGVEQANVNLATERATVVADPATAVDDLVAAVTKAGYTATLSGDEPPAAEDDRPTADAAATASTGEPVNARERQPDRDLASLKRKWQVSLTVGLSMMALMYVPLPIDAMDILMPALLVVATVI